jgi:hypothetical protein
MNEFELPIFKICLASRPGKSLVAVCVSVIYLYVYRVTPLHAYHTCTVEALPVALWLCYDDIL